MKIPQKLNGHRVIGSGRRKDHPDMAVVLVWRENNTYHPYVIATWSPSAGDGWHNGNYLATLRGACEAFTRMTSELPLYPSHTPDEYRFGRLRDMTKEEQMLFADANPNSRINDEDGEWLVIVDSTGEVQCYLSGLDICFAAAPGTNEWEKL